MTRPMLKDDVGFAVRFTQPGVLIVPVSLRTREPDPIVVKAVDATLTLEKIRTTRKLLSYFTLLLFLVAALLAWLHVPTAAILAVVLGLNAVMLAVQYAFQWAQLIQCEVTEGELREQRLKSTSD